MYNFSRDWTAGCEEYWNGWLGHLVDQKNIKGLEIGSFEGRSSNWFCKNILTGENSDLTCIDNFSFKTDTENKFDNNTNLSQITKLKGNSIERLSELILQKKQFDFIYVDGDHNAPNVLQDMCMSWQLLKDGGIMICDDYESPAVDNHKGVPIPVKPAVNSFLTCYKYKIEKYEITNTLKEKERRKQICIWKKRDYNNEDHILFLNNEGSTAHYYHFFYAVFLPLTAYLLNNSFSKDIYIRGCGDMGGHLFQHPIIIDEKINLRLIRKRDLIKYKNLKKIRGIDIHYEKQKAFFESNNNVRDYFNQKYNLLDIKQDKIILIDRLYPGSKRRSITNMDEVELALKNKYNNVERVSLEKLDIEQQAKIFSSAKIIIAQHGAGLSNLYFCKDGTSLLEIGANHRKDFFNISELLNIEYYVWNPTPNSDRNDHLNIDIDVLLENIEKIQSINLFRK